MMDAKLAITKGIIEEAEEGFDSLWKSLTDKDYPERAYCIKECKINWIKSLPDEESRLLLALTNEITSRVSGDQCGEFIGEFKGCTILVVNDLGGSEIVFNLNDYDKIFGGLTRSPLLFRIQDEDKVYIVAAGSSGEAESLVMKEYNDSYDAEIL